jgi:hypothetical protein
MQNIDDGGPAFPHEATAIHYGNSGMSLRDYFAAKALPACVSTFMENGDARGMVWDDYDDLARSVYRIADAMLRARAARTE